ncbi:unnamed protein product [Rotaria magnacalcarata]
MAIVTPDKNRLAFDFARKTFQLDQLIKQTPFHMMTPIQNQFLLELMMLRHSKMPKKEYFSLEIFVLTKCTFTTYTNIICWSTTVIYSHIIL